jgi:hypothetical protein
MGSNSHHNNGSSSNDFVKVRPEQYYEEENLSSISYNTRFIEANFGAIGDSVS